VPRERVAAEVSIPLAYADLSEDERLAAREGLAREVEAAMASGAIVATFLRESATYVLAREEDIR
jgi:hypothetical protein